VIGLGLLALGATVIVRLIRRVAGAPGPTRRAGPAALWIAAAVAAVTWRLAGPALAPLAGLLAHRVAIRVAATSPTPDLDEAVDLTATALGGGVAPPEALRVVADELPAVAVPLRRLAFGLELGVTLADARAGRPVVGTDLHRADGPLDRLGTVLAAADALGAPAVPTLQRLGADLRAEDLARVLAAAERLPAQLTFPTALCLLPATLLLVGAPIVHAGLAGLGT
jgi:pilus assembly protein TadC